MAACSLSNNSHRLSLSHVYSMGGVRVFYDVQGSHKIPDISDRNGNQVPDLVEDIALHTVVSRGVFNAAGFRDPVGSDRFRASSHIDVELVNFGVYRPTAQDNRGFAFSEQFRSSASKLRGTECNLMLVLNVAAPKFQTLVRGYLIPHEVFHLYQYASFPFKQGWLLEGLAKWAERATQDRQAFDRNSRLAEFIEDPRALVDRVIANPNPYATQAFWSALLGRETLPDDHCQVPAEWRLLIFSDGSPLIRNPSWHGCALVQRLFVLLEQRSAAIASSTHPAGRLWTESERRSPSCNREIAEALRLAIKQTDPAPAPLIQIAKQLSGLTAADNEINPQGIRAGPC